MHKIEIPQRVVESVVARRGTAHPFADLDPAKTALIVVDLQNGFMMDGVAHALCTMAREIVPNVNRLASAVRETGGQVFWIQNTHDESCLESWSNMHAMTLPEKTAKRIESMSEGTLGHELWADLDVKLEDTKVLKYRYSAFLPGYSDLPDILRARGLDTVLITGTVTNVCCESSARDAMMTNFKTIMVTDGNAATSDEEHNSSLINFYLTFGDIMSTDEVIDCLTKNAAGARSAAE
ncbi:MAG: cysteine hydrolase [Nisaea sp.]|uniref:isochorismatase family protein n=1 Tax=Nisaea sp. TaxID=2024842 RepID=UPI001B0666C7|nr:isochorismatase family cysteine hydrolase [Nisaea sp.]MBO6562731.1 cysteine hydrolase [Nisaea sp.]